MTTNYPRISTQLLERNITLPRFKIKNHNVPKKRELFMKILGIENDKLVYLEKIGKKWNLPFWPISI